MVAQIRRVSASKTPFANASGIQLAYSARIHSGCILASLSLFHSPAPSRILLFTDAAPGASIQKRRDRPGAFQRMLFSRDGRLAAGRVRARTNRQTKALRRRYRARERSASLKPREVY